MAKVFTITEGLENMGAIKTGGQGSVYKGRRMGEIITAIKIIPTPIHSESEEDKNYTSFKNEVEKLKKVNEDPIPNVVKIISSGITDSGNFPFIEMEFIEGPDLEELLQPPNPPVFTVAEVLKVADQLSFALSHCHKLGIRHGDIKSNNVKYNVKTGNYVLLDFGLAVMSDEQRRTSFRQAGAIEFMAPEQNEGMMLFQTDVYSFGIILFELLAGNVPFPLKDKGEISRNHVAIAHAETPPPDLLSIRQAVLPAGWTDEKRQREMDVPDWLLTLIYKCLEKVPESRFANGIELHEFVGRNRLRALNPVELSDERIKFLEEENMRLREEREHLLEQLRQQESLGNSTIRTTPISSDPSTIEQAKGGKKRQLSVGAIIGAVLILIAIAAGVYFLTKIGSSKNTLKAVQSNTAAKPKQAEESPEVTAQLKSAKEFLEQDKIVEALTIYSTLANSEVPEAMYQYARLALQDKNNNISCTDAAALLGRASEKNYTPAKRTLGMLYCFADDEATLKAANYYERCKFNKDVLKGSKLLMEATLEGDQTSSQLLDELKKRQQ